MTKMLLILLVVVLIAVFFGAVLTISDSDDWRDEDEFDYSVWEEREK